MLVTLFLLIIVDIYIYIYIYICMCVCVCVCSNTYKYWLEKQKTLGLDTRILSLWCFSHFFFKLPPIHRSSHFKIILLLLSLIHTHTHTHTHTLSLSLSLFFSSLSLQPYLQFLWSETTNRIFPHITALLPSLLPLLLSVLVLPEVSQSPFFFSPLYIVSLKRPDIPRDPT